VVCPFVASLSLFLSSSSLQHQLTRSPTSKFKNSQAGDKVLVEDTDDADNEDGEESHHPALREVRLPEEGEMGQELKRLCAAEKDVCKHEFFSFPFAVLTKLWFTHRIFDFSPMV
jgi:hypothetical protein